MPTPQSILSTTFGYTEFMGRQEAVNQPRLGWRQLPGAHAHGRRQVHVLPDSRTSSGRVGVVVSPRIALMQDQVRGLLQAGVKAACLNSSIPPKEAWEVERNFREGGLDLLYVAPERACRKIKIRTCFLCNQVCQRRICVSIR
jgi:ATP-dependent DNA helicase RecQ